VVEYNLNLIPGKTEAKGESMNEPATQSAHDTAAPAFPGKEPAAKPAPKAKGADSLPEIDD
jgi:hypothetical protein